MLSFGGDHRFRKVPKKKPARLGPANGFRPTPRASAGTVYNPQRSKIRQSVFNKLVAITKLPVPHRPRVSRAIRQYPVAWVHLAPTLRCGNGPHLPLAFHSRVITWHKPSARFHGRVSITVITEQHPCTLSVDLRSGPVARTDPQQTAGSDNAGVRNTRLQSHASLLN